MKKILDCAVSLPHSGNGWRVSNKDIEAIILVMLYGGLRLSDASKLRRSEIKGDELSFDQCKNGIHVDTVLPEFVLTEFDALPKKYGDFYFYGATKGVKSRSRAWYGTLDLVFEFAKIKDAGSHRFRHTYASRALQACVSIDDLS